MSRYLLMIDDDPEILALTAEMLRSHNYEVGTAENGIMGLQEIRKRRPDLILADVLMPQMDGYSFYKELKNSPMTADIPVLIITGRAKMEDSFKVMGVDGFMTKPFTSADLIGEIEHILRINEHKQKIIVGEKKSTRNKILAAGMDKFVLDNMNYQAERAGYVIETVLTGADAIARAVKFFPDIVFIDILLYDLNPVELIEILRRLPLLEKKPIIGYCYYATDDLGDKDIRKKILRINEASKRIMQCGATFYMGRYNHQIFIKTIMDHIDKKTS